MVPSADTGPLSDQSRAELRAALAYVLTDDPFHGRASLETERERDTADVLGISVGTVKSQTHDALSRLRELVPDLTIDPNGGVR